jgi:hypothetical protein
MVSLIHIQDMKMVNLNIQPEKAIILINERIDAIKTIKGNQYGLEYYDVIGWFSKTCSVIDEIYGDYDIHTEEIRSIGLSNCFCNSHIQALLLAEIYHSRLVDYAEEIRTTMKIPE